MKRATISWAAAGILVSLCTVVLLCCGLHSSPAILVDPADLTEAVQQVMTCAVSGDYDALGGLLYGSPDLGTVPEDDQSAQSLIWKAFHESIQYECSETCYLLDSQAALDLRVTCLDIAAVTDALQKSAPKLLMEKARALGDEKAVYDEAHNYRADFLAEVMGEAAAQALASASQTMERELTLQFARVGDQWQIVPTEQLLQFLSGFVSE